MNTIKIGIAGTVINNDIGTDIQAATHLNKVKYIRDDLEANALWLETADEALLLGRWDAHHARERDTPRFHRTGRRG